MNALLPSTGPRRTPKRLPDDLATPHLTPLQLLQYTTAHAPYPSCSPPTIRPDHPGPSRPLAPHLMKLDTGITRRNNQTPLPLQSGLSPARSPFPTSAPRFAPPPHASAPARQKRSTIPHPPKRPLLARPLNLDAHHTIRPTINRDPDPMLRLREPKRRSHLPPRGRLDQRRHLRRRVDGRELGA